MNSKILLIKVPKQKIEQIKEDRGDISAKFYGIIVLKNIVHFKEKFRYRIGGNAGGVIQKGYYVMVKSNNRSYLDKVKAYIKENYSLKIIETRVFFESGEIIEKIYKGNDENIMIIESFDEDIMNINKSVESILSLLK